MESPSRPELSFSIEKILSKATSLKKDTGSVYPYYEAIFLQTHGLENLSYPTHSKSYMYDHYTTPYTRKEKKCSCHHYREVKTVAKPTILKTEDAYFEDYKSPSPIKREPSPCIRKHSVNSTCSDTSTSITNTSSVSDDDTQLDTGRRNRTIFSKKQAAILEEIFQKTHYPDLKCRYEVSQKTKLSENRIQVWFQNRRAKWRRTEKTWGEGSVMAKYGLYGAMVRHSLKARKALQEKTTEALS